MFKDKIEESKNIIRMVMKEYKDPIIYSGFGKDSICIIHLCRTLGLNWPIMFHREPYFPKKYRYANKIIDLWNLTCFDYPAHGTAIFYENNIFEVVRYFSIGYGNLALCAMVYLPDKLIEGEYLCALKDIYQQPKGHGFDYRWDVALQGFRYDEKKPQMNMEPARLRWVNKQNIGSVDVVNPLRDWTNQEVCQYIIENDIPVNTDVYEITDGELVPKINPATGQIDSTYNPDRRAACFECMKPDNPMMVLCPKKMCTVNNVYSELKKEEMLMPDFPDPKKELKKKDQL
jgi:3'-phosphoadenosine 5'-phosphosulfate sulfotransferase (PAPS reductase)/FAD synthetase